MYICSCEVNEKTRLSTVPHRIGRLILTIVVTILLLLLLYVLVILALRELSIQIMDDAPRRHVETENAQRQFQASFQLLVYVHCMCIVNQASDFGII